MPKSLFDVSMEKELLRLYVEVFAGSSGRTLTTAEKHATIAERLNSQSVVLGWPTVTASNVDNKIDAVRRKGKKVYKTFRLKTRTGASVEDDVDLKVSKLFWREYVLYSGLYYSFSFFLYRLLTKSGQTSMCTTLFFKSQSFGPGGNNADTAGNDDDDGAAHGSEPSTPTPTPAPALPPSAGKTRYSDSNSDLEAGKKPSRKTTRKRSTSFEFCELYSKMRKEEKAVEENRERERQNLELMLHKERQEAEDRRERERREYEEGGAREQREYKEKREAERAKARAEVRQSEKEFNAALLAKLFNKKLCCIELRAGIFLWYK